MTATRLAGPRPPKRPAPPSDLPRRIGLALAVAALILLVLVLLIWLNRRAATRQVLVGWLEQHGVPAEVDIQTVELDRMVARIRLGDPRNPDAVVERVEVDYALGTPWSRAGLGVTPSRIRLVQPVLRATLKDGRVSLGSLDPVIEEFTGRPPRPDSRAPLVLVERGRVLLTTDYGEAVVLADARVDNGKLMRLAARMPTQSLKSRHADAREMSGALNLVTIGDRITVQGGFQAARLTAGVNEAEAPVVSVAGDLPYPDLKQRRGDGIARLTLQATAARARAGQTRLRGGAARVVFDGRTDGWLDAFNLTGALDTAVRAEVMSAPGLDLTRAALSTSRAALTVSGGTGSMTWRVEGPMSLSAGAMSGPGLSGRDVRLASARGLIGGRGRAAEFQGGVDLTAGRLDWDQLRLEGVGGRARMDAVIDDGLRLSATGGMTARRGAWPLLGAPTSGDVPELVEMKRAVSNFSLSAPAFDLLAGDAGARLSLRQPVTLAPANGGTLTIRERGGPMFSAAGGQAAGGAFALTATRGRGLPEAQFEVTDYRLADGGFIADLNGRAALDFGLARGLTLQTQGRLTSRGGVVTYAASSCVPLTVERLELGENDVLDLTGGLCPGDAPLVDIRQGGWTVRGAMRDVAARAPFLALDIREASGQLLARGRPGGIDLDFAGVAGQVVDATTPRRFHTLSAQGSAGLRGDIWTGAFDLSRQGVDVARLTLRHDARANVGGLDIDAPSIVFAEDGLQPSDLSPLAGEFVGSPAVGSVGFEGRVDWAVNTEGSSRGRLTIPGLDFVSPAGPVKGLRGTVDFVNLAPLETAPDQRLHADSIEAVAEFRDVDVVFDLDKAALRIDGTETTVGGGKVRLEPLTLPLEPGQGFTGVIVLENVQLNDVIAGAGFGDKVRLDAVVSGRLPFTSDPQRGVRITGGTLAAVQPGRLSIAREALSGLEAGGGGDVPPNTIQDLAYQAMENLSFDILSAEVNSLDAGRLGVLFHIRGRHDPPVRQELRVGIAELISRQFLNRKLPLPSGTAIDLTLDTTLNANQLVGDLLAINRARSGDPDDDQTP